MKAEELIDFYPIVASYVVSELDFVSSIDDRYFVACTLLRRKHAIDVVECQQLVEIIWPVPPNQQPLRLEIGVEEVFLSDGRN